jgi:phosphohistidine phosphatase
MAVLELYLIRHGIAAERGDDYPDDSKRPLTNDGISSLRKEVAALEIVDVAFDHIITSPLVRTKQTAEIFAQHLP